MNLNTFINSSTYVKVTSVKKVHKMTITALLKKPIKLNDVLTKL